MTVSHNSPQERKRAAVAAAALSLVLLCGCAGGTRAPTPAGRLLEPLVAQAAQMPDEVDHAAVRVAAAALGGSHAEAGEALAGLERAIAQDPLRASRQRKNRVLLSDRLARETLLPLAIDLVNSAADDGIRYRAGARQLLERSDLNPAQRARLEMAAADDPLALAAARIRDHRESLWAQAFNAASRPLGQTLLIGLVLAPYTIAQVAVHYVAGLNERPIMSTQERQALGHWKRFLAGHPDAPEAEQARLRIREAEAELERLFADQYRRGAENALEHHQPRRALAYAKRARLHAPDDEEAADLEQAAAAQVAQLEANRARSLEAPAELVVPSETEIALARALLVAPKRIPAAARRLRQVGPSPRPSLRDAAGFSLAIVQRERGFEDASIRNLDHIARGDPQRSTLARHAAALITNPYQNPYGDFQRAVARARRQEAAHKLMGSWAERPRYRSLPVGLAYLIDAPAVAQSILTAPLRLLFESWRPPSDRQRPAALAAYRYLGRNPSGTHGRELLDWLLDYERRRDHHAAALRLADFIPGFDPAERAELAEAAAAQRLEAAGRSDRFDIRASLLRDTVREFPDTASGHSAGLAARRDALETTAQSIRLTRGFIDENPRIAASGGLGLRQELLDDDLGNGELHPQGVSFLGGRTIGIALVAESGDEDDEPVVIKQRLSEERLARTVALLEEATLLGARLDPDDVQTDDARRDLYLERARLGLTEQADRRPTAHSNYVYRGVRERYGLVRGRESILPFDLVVQGSLIDLSLAAFPRWREPEKTPDAFLYR